jgi:hypothetical protein
VVSWKSLQARTFSGRGQRVVSVRHPPSGRRQRGPYKQEYSLNQGKGCGVVLPLAVVGTASVHDANPEGCVALVRETMHTKPATQSPACAAVPAVRGVVARTSVGLVTAAPVSLGLIGRNHTEGECCQSRCNEERCEEAEGSHCLREYADEPGLPRTPRLLEGKRGPASPRRKVRADPRNNPIPL